MVSRRLIFTYPPELIKEPIIHNLDQQFNLITNIRRADIVEDRGWVIIEIEGKEEDIEQGITWATSKGMRVDPVTEDITEGQD